MGVSDYVKELPQIGGNTRGKNPTLSHCDGKPHTKPVEVLVTKETNLVLSYYFVTDGVIVYTSKAI